MLTNELKNGGQCLVICLKQGSLFYLKVSYPVRYYHVMIMCLFQKQMTWMWLVWLLCVLEPLRSGCAQVHNTSLPGSNSAILAPHTLTSGGNSGGSACVFPFLYQGYNVYACILTNWDRPWCSTTTDYETDRRWGECICKY